MVDVLSHATIFQEHNLWQNVEKKKMQFQKSKVKTILGVILFCSKGIINKKFISQGTMNASHYLQMLDHLCKKIAC